MASSFYIDCIWKYDKINIGKYTSPGFMLGYYIQAINGIQFEDNVYIAPGVKIISANHDSLDYRLHKTGKSITFGNNEWIGANAIILPEVSIGNDVIIGACSVITHDIEDNSIAVGNPARVIRHQKERNNSINNLEVIYIYGEYL